MAVSLRDRIVALLRGSTVGRIRFSFPSGATNITITAASYHRVARAIQRGDISLAVSNTLGPNVGAQYDPNPGHGLTGTLTIPPQYIGRELEGRIVHECTHAIFDIDSVANLTALTEEAAAYVAQVLYYRMTGLPEPRWGTPIRDMALLAVNEMLKQYQAGNTPIPVVDLTDFHLIRAIIPVSPTYGVTPSQPGGTPASTGGSYVHNG